MYLVSNPEGVYSVGVMLARSSAASWRMFSSSIRSTEGGVIVRDGVCSPLLLVFFA